MLYNITELKRFLDRHNIDDGTVLEDDKGHLWVYSKARFPRGGIETEHLLQPIGGGNYFYIAPHPAVTLKDQFILKKYC